MKNKITITRDEFHDKLCEIVSEFMANPYDVIKFSIFSAKAELAFFGDDKEDDNTNTEAPFKVGDKVFVIDNKDDGNRFVNQVVTVTEINDDECEVANGEYLQSILFDNLRKVETS